MSELQPITPSSQDGDGSVDHHDAEPLDPAPITEQEVGEYREQDRYLPVREVLHTLILDAVERQPKHLNPQIANVSRIMKASVPPTAKIAKDAKECVQECVSEFISFITSEAAEKCQMEKRKTIGGEDILSAMSTLGFENYAETLKIHLAKLRQVRCLESDLHPHWPDSSLVYKASVWDVFSCTSEPGRARRTTPRTPWRRMMRSVLTM